MSVVLWVPAVTAAMPAITSLGPPLMTIRSFAATPPAARKASICSVTVAVVATPAASGLIATRALPTA